MKLRVDCNPAGGACGSTQLLQLLYGGDVAPATTLGGEILAVRGYGTSASPAATLLATGSATGSATAAGATWAKRKITLDSWTATTKRSSGSRRVFDAMRRGARFVVCSIVYS